VASVTAIGIITALILLNGLFVAAEFAIVGVPRSVIERRAAAGSGVARLVLATLRDPQRQDRYIATAQLGITLASLGLGMYGEHVLATWLANLLEGLGSSRWIAAHTVASVLSVGILTYFHIVVGEMVPKALALEHAARTALWVTPAIRVVQTVAFPLVVALNGIGNGVLRLLGIRRQAGGSEHYRTPEELAYIVKESQAGGLLRRESARVFGELLEFGELTAGEVMVPRVRAAGIPVGASAAAIAAALQVAPHTRYLVWDGTPDRVLGAVHIKDLLVHLDTGRALLAEDARPVPFVPETAPLDEVLAAMRAERVQIAVVMDEHGGTAGLVTIEDLFEEVVGQIDEFHALGATIYTGSDGRLRVPGTARLDEVGDRLGLVLEHDEVDTVSGLVLDLLGKPPSVGDAVVYDHLRFEVSALDGRGVRECIVTPAEAPAPDASV
jgi:CBS domain containing-hemolysin-like protein